MQVSGVDLLACGSIPTLPAIQTTTPSTKHPISDSVCKHSLQISHLSVYQDYRVMNELSRTLSETFPAWGLHAPQSMHVASLHPHPIECENIGSRLRDSRVTHGFRHAVLASEPHSVHTPRYRHAHLSQPPPLLRQQSTLSNRDAV
jgi:hypothetical protein